jgi:tetratricopeptide (TPR) repeat protein
VRKLLALAILIACFIPGIGAGEELTTSGPAAVSARGPSTQLGIGGHPQTLDRRRLAATLRTSRLAMDPRMSALPGAQDPDIRQLWELALSLEDRGERKKAASVYESIAPHIQFSAAAHWRIARMHWRIGDLMPNNETKGSGAYAQYRIAESWARRGLEIDEKCAECMLWLYAALGRITVSEGLLSGVKYARTMSTLLDDGIALQPSYRDSDINSTLGNLYYARAIFNRMVPDWWWLGILVGVRGDREQALRDIDQALALNGNRIDYQVEKGAVLMCLGSTRSREQRIEEGRVVLREAMTFERRFETDELDLQLAQQMIETPEKACGFTREGFVDVAGEAKKL